MALLKKKQLEKRLGLERELKMLVIQAEAGLVKLKCKI